MSAILVALAVLAGEPAPAQRVALVVGHSTGTPRQARLRFAHDDARAFGEVMRTLGRVRRVDELIEPSAAELDARLDRLARELGPEDEAVFYYSGHADESALVLGGERYPFERLKGRLRALPARLFVAVLDACQSGGFAKGAVPVAVQIDEPRAGEHRGGIVITASSPDELALESDELGGSIFTSALLGGLRGAADDSGDRVVSLEEAYRYAYRRTVGRSAKTLLGAHHPRFEWDVRGQDELVLTWLEHARSRLVVLESAAGSYLVRTAAGRPIAEFEKAPGRRLSIALPPDRYEIVKTLDGSFGRAEIEVEAGREAILDEERLELRPLDELRAKGAGPTLALALLYDARAGYLADSGPGHFGRLRATLELSSWAASLGVGVGRSEWTRDDRVAVGLTELEARASAGPRWHLGGGAELRVMAELGVALALQVASLPTGSIEERSGLVIPAELAFGVAFGLGGPVRAALEGHGGLMLFGSDGLEVRGTAGLRAGVEVEL